jgi:putative transposase
MTLPEGPNQHWLLDVVSDPPIDGRRVRIPAVIGELSREYPATSVDSSIQGVRVARELGRIALLRCYPDQVISDNGTGLTAHAILIWQEERGVGWHLIRPGKPMQIGLVE